jgi:hypothetical protein
MAKNRDKSDILNISIDSDKKGMNSDTAIEALLNQRTQLKSLLKQIEGDLESLGHTFNEDT